MSQNVEEPPEKRQLLARVENKDLDCLLALRACVPTQFLVSPKFSSTRVSITL